MSINHRSSVELLLRHSDPSILVSNVHAILEQLDQGVSIHFLARQPIYALEFQALTEALYTDDFAVEFRGVNYVGHTNRYCVTFLAEAPELEEHWEDFIEYAKEALVLNWDALEHPQPGVVVVPFFGADRRAMLDVSRLLKVAGFERLAESFSQASVPDDLSLEETLAAQLGSSILCGVPPAEVVSFEELGIELGLIEPWTQGPLARTKEELLATFNNVLARLQVAHEQLTF